MSDPDPDSDANSNWKYGLDEVGEDAEEPETELHPGSPSAENSFFVALGVLTMLATFARIVLMAV